jgi:hypothetical protein
MDLISLYPFFEIPLVTIHSLWTQSILAIRCRNTHRHEYAISFSQFQQHALPTEELHAIIMSVTVKITSQTSTPSMSCSILTSKQQQQQQQESSVVLG